MGKSIFSRVVDRDAIFRKAHKAGDYSRDKFRGFCTVYTPSRVRRNWRDGASEMMIVTVTLRARASVTLPLRWVYMCVYVEEE